MELGKVPVYSLEFHILEPYLYMLSMNCWVEVSCGTCYRAPLWRLLSAMDFTFIVDFLHLLLLLLLQYKPSRAKIKGLKTMIFTWYDLIFVRDVKFVCYRSVWPSESKIQVHRGDFRLDRRHFIIDCTYTSQLPFYSPHAHTCSVRIILLSMYIRMAYRRTLQSRLSQDNKLVKRV